MNDDAGSEDLPAEMNKTRNKIKPSKTDQQRTDPRPAFPVKLMKQLRKMPDMEVMNKPE